VGILGALETARLLNGPFKDSPLFIESIALIKWNAGHFARNFVAVF
jgi:hypothetical protein